jgi:hypothetical protein
MLFGAELCSQMKRSSSRRTMVVLGCIETKPRNSRYDERYVEPTERSGRFSVNVWGWISAVSPGVMLHVEERLNSGVYIRILENVYTSHRVATWFQDQNINILDWPSRSPDVNPIENMWSFLVRQRDREKFIVIDRNSLLRSQMHGTRYLRTTSEIYALPNRLRKVLDANGAVTKY